MFSKIHTATVERLSGLPRTIMSAARRGGTLWARATVRAVVYCAVALSTLAAGTANAGPAEGKVEFGLISPRHPEQTQANWAPFAARMEKALGLRVNLKVYESQDALVREFVDGLLDLAWVGNAPALDIVEKGVGSVFAQMVNKDGSLGYRSVLVTRAESKLQDLQGLIGAAKNLRLGEGDPKSTSGFLVPMYFAFHKNGISDTKVAFSTVRTGSHQENLRRVVEGDVDVAIANNEELGFFYRDFPAHQGKLKVIWESPVIPQSPLVWQQSLPAAFKRKVAQFVTTFGSSDPEEKAILLNLNGLSRFRASTNHQLVTIADMEMFRARKTVSMDPALSPEQRQERIAQIIQRSSHLEMRLKIHPF
jgi:phosphonate transport system substrate-binding protein